MSEDLFGFIGLGNMANKFAQAIREVNNAKLVSIASKSISKLCNRSNLLF